MKRFFITFCLVFFLTTFFQVFSPGLAGVSAQGLITDMAGRKVALPDNISRIVTTYHTASQFIFALGAGDRLVAGETGIDSLELFQKLRPEIANLPTVGSKRKGLNLEEIISVNPDLVVLYPYNDGPEAARRLSELGIASLIINPESYREIRETNLLLGKALNLKEKARGVDRQYEKILKLAERTGRLDKSDRKVVYFANSELLDTVGKGMLQTSLIELAGGINPAADLKAGFIKTSPEELYRWDPDLIVTSQRFQGEISKLLNNPRYQSLKAFKNGEIYRSPANIEPWDFPGPSSYLLITWLGKRLYPGLYRDIELPDFINDFYQNIYGLSYEELGGKF